MDKIAVLIPCYNESKTIQKVIEDFKAALPSAVIYVYDNNSKDGTDEIARSCGAVVRYEYKQGKGNVIRRMFREVDAHCYLIVDGNDTYPAESAQKMCDIVLNKNVDMVVGDRLSSTYFKENKRAFHNLGNSLVRGSVNRLFKSDVKDIMTGYRAFSYQFIKSFPVISKGFEIETEMTIHAVDKNMLVANHVVDYHDRPEGSFSKLNTFRDGFRVLKTIAKLFKIYKPLKFFGIIAFLLTILAAGVFVPIYILNLPFIVKFIISVLCALVQINAVFAFFTGIVLNVANHKNRCDFEMELHRISDNYKNLSKSDSKSVTNNKKSDFEMELKRISDNYKNLSKSDSKVVND